MINGQQKHLRNRRQCKVPGCEWRGSTVVLQQHMIRAHGMASRKALMRQKWLINRKMEGAKRMEEEVIEQDA